MIAAEFFTTQEGVLLGFHITGHAGFSRSGEDIVCASVSSAAYMTANTITEIIHANATVSVDDEDGEMFLRVPKRDAASCRDLLSGFKLHLLALEEQYPDHIHVNYTEV